MTRLPRWADIVLTPLLSLVLAFAISALVILAIGENPWTALTTMVTGALGSSYGWGFTLYYAPIIAAGSASPQCGHGSASATSATPRPPSVACPSAPMLNSPAWLATATASAVKMKFVA